MEYFVAKTFAGLETELFKELHALGAQNCQKLSRAVAFEGDMEMLYRANYYCRTALRILWRQKRFKFRNNRQYYEQIFDFPAENYLSPDGTLAVHATNVDSIFKTPLFASVLAKDAICDRFREHFDRRPSVDKDYPDVQFHLHIYQDEAQLFMDSSGESLHKRGYKVRNHPAPLNEVVAAAMIMKSGWNATCDFVDPMCGGGTLLIEAAMQALNIPAGFYRREYGFYQWKNFDRQMWRKVREEADIKDDVAVNFYGSDIDSRFVDTWEGLAFERVCLVHVDEIKKALQIGGVVCEVSPWRSSGDEPVQIDMLINRNDGVVNLCEMKFSREPYELTADELARMQRRRKVFKDETGMRKAVHLTMVVSPELKKNAYANEIQSTVMLDDLFRE